MTLIPMAWLTERVTDVAVLEDDRTPPEGGLPFGGRNADWAQMKGMLLDGDELWLFAAPDNPAYGGVALIREGLMIAFLING